MNSETPKPWVSRDASYIWSLVFTFLTLKSFHQASSSSSAPHDDDPKHQSPESTLQGGSDMGRPPHPSLFKSALNFRSASASASALASSSSSSSAISFGEKDTLTSSPPFGHSQVNSTSPTRDSFSSNKLSPSSPTKHSHDPSARNTNSQNLHAAEAERWEHVMQTIDKLELGKYILGLAIPMAMGLVFSNNPLALTKNMQGVAISLCFAFAATWNGLLLRKIYPKASLLILILGIALMMLAFYAFVGCFLPLHLQWIPALCWLASLIPYAIFVWAHFQRKKVKDPEKGETDGPKL